MGFGHLENALSILYSSQWHHIHLHGLEPAMGRRHAGPGHWSTRRVSQAKVDVHYSKLHYSKQAKRLCSAGQQQPSVGVGCMAPCACTTNDKQARLLATASITNPTPLDHLPVQVASTDAYQCAARQLFSQGSRPAAPRGSICGTVTTDLCSMHVYSSPDFKPW